MPSRKNVYATHLTAPTPQSRPIPGREAEMVKNAAGGYGWRIDDWQQLTRFLIIGSEGGTYYIGERELTLANAGALQRCLKADGSRVVNLIADIAAANRAPKPDALIFALALACSPKYSDPETRDQAFAIMGDVVRTGTQLFQFCDSLQTFRGWGRQARRAVGQWYTSKLPRDLAYQLIKYRQRDGWSHRDVLRLTHAHTNEAVMNGLLHWAVKGDWNTLPDGVTAETLYPQVHAFEKVQQAEKLADVVRLITEHRLPREAIPTRWFNEREVWAALLVDMPVGALIRNLAKMTEIGLLAPMATANQLVIGRLTNVEQLRKARVHPINVLSALKVYQSGHGVRGSLAWTPVAQIVDALDDAFYLALESVEPTNARILSCPDISGSMNAAVNGLPGLSCFEAAGALTMVDVNREPNQATLAWGSNAHQLSLGRNTRLDDMMQTLRGFNEGTDASVPVNWALANKVPVDAFVVYTDTESWAGNSHLYQALETYRQAMGINSRVVVAAMASNTTTLIPPDDPGCMDMVGLDASGPSIISEFVRGNL